jgi:hypothetical protein
VIEDFRDLLNELVASNVQFMVVGAHALSVHGVPRDGRSRRVDSP